MTRTEVLVIGAGPAGIAAATAAAENGRQVIVLDDNVDRRRPDLARRYRRSTWPTHGDDGSKRRALDTAATIRSAGARRPLCVQRRGVGNVADFAGDQLRQPR